MSGKGKKGDGRNVVIRREEIVEGGHHGGAWKVAYADFVTAMMAFFLLMWLLNATTEAQRKGLADYFTPSSQLSHASSGTGQPFGGHTPFDHGDLVSDRGVETLHPGREPPPDDRRATPRPPEPKSPEPKSPGPAPPAPKPVAAPPAIAPASPPPPPPARSAADAARRQQAAREKQNFAAAAAQIRDAVRKDPAAAGLLSQLSIDEVPAGLRIQLLDQDRRPMFANGSAAMNEQAVLLLRKIAPILARLPEPIAISGHTDAAPYPTGPNAEAGMNNWTLSSARAEATRRILTESGLQDGRVRSVTGNADRDPLLPADPLAAANRRIAILVLRSGPPATP
jgi:chemotaxis protein MotB